LDAQVVAQAPGAHQVLDAQRDAGQRRRIAGGQTLVSRSGLAQGTVRIDGQISADFAVHRVDAVQHRPGQLNR
jgi:hypothetical protein